METKHTKGEWTTEGCSNGGLIVCLGDTKDWQSQRIQIANIANAKLIAASPELLKKHIVNYLSLLVNMPFSFRATSEGQMILSTSLSAICLGTGHDRQATQDFFEDLYCRVKTKELTFEEAIKKATE